MKCILQSVYHFLVTWLIVVILFVAHIWMNIKHITVKYEDECVMWRVHLLLAHNVAMIWQLVTELVT